MLPNKVQEKTVRSILLDALRIELRAISSEYLFQKITKKNVFRVHLHLNQRGREQVNMCRCT